MTLWAFNFLSFDGKDGAFEKALPVLFVQNDGVTVITLTGIRVMSPGVWTVAEKMEFQCICSSEIPGEKRNTIAEAEFDPVIGKFNEPDGSRIIIGVTETNRGNIRVSYFGYGPIR
jgi:hypothetical protein